MRRTKTRLISLLLALVMVLGLLPGTAWAAEENITVYVSVADMTSEICPGFQYDTNEYTTLMYRVPVEVSAGSTARDVMEKVHTRYCNDGNPETSEFICSDSGWITKFWGVGTSGYGGEASFSYRVNSEYVDAATAVVMNDGDDMDCYIFAYGSTNYSYFDQRFAVVKTGESLTLTLHNEYYDASFQLREADVSGAQLDVAEDCEGTKIFWGTGLGETDSNGQVTVSFDTAGTYELTATTEGNSIVTPVCTVTVLDYEVTDEVLAQYAAKNLTWEDFKGSNINPGSVIQGMTLPAAVPGFDGFTVDWSCPYDFTAGYVSTWDGITSFGVDRPLSQDADTVLTAVFQKDGDTVVTKEFPITVKAEGVSEDKATVVHYGSLMGGIAANYADDNGGGWSVTSAIEDNDLAWAVLDMQAYGSALGVEMSDYETGLENNSAAAKYILAEHALGRAITAPEVDGANVWSAPFILLARYAAGTTNKDDNIGLLTTMVDYLNGTYLDMDTVAMILPALAPYCGEADVSAAIDKAVAWLSGQQNADGTFSDYSANSVAESTAQVIVALSALGIDAHTDSRFVKNYKSAVEGLLTFALSDNSGFGHKGNVTYNAMSTEQGFRALVAYARFKESGAAYNIYLQAKESGETVAAPNITATTKPSGGSGSGNTNCRITVSVMVPPEGGAEGQYTYRYDSGKYTNLLGSARRVTVDRNTTALEVLTSLLDEADISYAESSGYVSEIGGLAELDHGPNSGWQYMVDGAAPSEPASTYTFRGNGTLVWYFTDDYTKEKDADSWSGGSAAQVSTDAKVTENQDSTYSVTLSGNSSGPALVVIPDVGSGKAVVIVHKDGTGTVVKKSLVEDGTARFLLTEDATVRIADFANHFDDVGGDEWYGDAVDFVSARGLFSGVSEREFAPGMTLSRGMLATVLYALEEPKDQPGESGFSDVDRDSWYAQAVAWASGAGIVSGYGDGQFGPEDPVTREQLALMLYCYARQLGMDTTGRDSLSCFADREQVSSWAGEAIAWAVDAGVMGGRTDGTLDPAGTATRAEAAVMLRQFVKLLVG